MLYVGCQEARSPVKMHEHSPQVFLEKEIVGDLAQNRD